MKESFQSAVAGWTASAIAFSIASAVHNPTHYLGDWMWVGFTIALFSSPAFLIIWFVALWPLYALLPPSSIIWQPLICTVVGAIAGAGVLFFILRYVFGYARHDVPLVSHLAIGATAGAVICLTARHFKKHESNVA